VCVLVAGELWLPHIKNGSTYCWSERS